MFTVLNRNSEAVSTSTAWSRNDIENKNLYNTRLFRTYIEVDGGKIFKVIEWVVTRIGESDFTMTVPLCFGIRHRNCKILKDEEIFSSGEPFNINEEEVRMVNGKFTPAYTDDKPLMVTYRCGSICTL